MPNAKISKIAQGFERFSSLQRLRENLRNKTLRQDLFATVRHAARGTMSPDHESCLSRRNIKRVDEEKWSRAFAS
jgi:hypothetical protein